MENHIFFPVSFISSVNQTGAKPGNSGLGRSSRFSRADIVIKEGRAFGLADPGGLSSKQKRRLTARRKKPWKQERLSAEVYLPSARPS